MNAHRDIGGIEGKLRVFITTQPDLFGHFHLFAELSEPGLPLQRLHRGFFESVESAEEIGLAYLREYGVELSEEAPPCA